MTDLTRDINPSQGYINDYVELDNGMIVNRYGMCFTSFVDYTVWEPLNGHSTLTTIGEKRCGKLTTRPLPAEIDALPGWTPGYWPNERIAAVQEFLEGLEMQAERIIRATFPQDFADEQIEGK